MKVHPEIRVSIIGRKQYVMVFLNPENPHKHFLRPELLHVTLTQSYPSDWMLQSLTSGGRSNNPIVRRLQAMLTALKLPTKIALKRSQYKSSWTFGVPEPWAEGLVALRHFAVYVIKRELDPDQVFLEHRELHVSWH